MRKMFFSLVLCISLLASQYLLAQVISPMGRDSLPMVKNANPDTSISDALVNHLGIGLKLDYVDSLVLEANRDLPKKFHAGFELLEMRRVGEKGLHIFYLDDNTPKSDITDLMRVAMRRAFLEQTRANPRLAEFRKLKMNISYIFKNSKGQELFFIPIHYEDYKEG